MRCNRCGGTIPTINHYEEKQPGVYAEVIPFAEGECRCIIPV